MRLRKECEHGRWEEHYGFEVKGFVCPGGEFLPEGALVIEKGDLVIPRDADGNWPMGLLDEIKEQGDTNPWVVQSAIEFWLEGTVASQVGESE